MKSFFYWHILKLLTHAHIRTTRSFKLLRWFLSYSLSLSHSLCLLLSCPLYNFQVVLVFLFISVKPKVKRSRGKEEYHDFFMKGLFLLSLWHGGCVLIAETGDLSFFSSQVSFPVSLSDFRPISIFELLFRRSFVHGHLLFFWFAVSESLNSFQFY